MIYASNTESPFKIFISFQKLVEALEEIASSNVDYRANYAKGLLSEVYKFPELCEGITDLEALARHEILVKHLLSDLFPTALTHNEIKAAAIPFSNVIFNFSNRFEKILDNAGTDLDLNIRDFSDEEVYVMSCCLILRNYYKRKIDFVKPLFYDIPDSNGIILHYRILYNVDFVEILPSSDVEFLTEKEIDHLINNYDDYELWREKFPIGSWSLKGFGMMTLYDATTESAVSNLKTNLLGKKNDASAISDNIQIIFKSIFKIPDLKIGFTAISSDGNQFTRAPFDNNLTSFILNKNNTNTEKLMCGTLFDCVLKKHNYFSVSNLEQFIKENPNNELLDHFQKLGIRSFLLAPLISKDKFLGIVELVSFQKNQLNSINAHKLDIVLPYLLDTMERFYEDTEIEIEAIIQREYTAIHPSVYWKFREEAAVHVGISKSSDLPYKEIVFENVWPLYGQIDIQDSSTHRNEVALKDLQSQIDLLITLFADMSFVETHHEFTAVVNDLQSFKTVLSKMLKADSENIIHDFILNECHPLMERFRNSSIQMELLVEGYFAKVDKESKLVYKFRKEYDFALSVINKKLASVLDFEQEKAQVLFPHYFERFKTDGVEHNLYIGASINPKIPYKSKYLKYLRLWQLLVACTMECEYHLLRNNLKYNLDVTSLILVFNSPISIRFRMDERRFDVDGSYNARYEVVKKRIDKATIKDTAERITKKGFITIVYSQNHEAKEYKTYINFLQSLGYFTKDVAAFEVESLQGVSGLKAFRVAVNYERELTNFDFQQTIEAFKSFEKM